MEKTKVFDQVSLSHCQEFQARHPTLTRLPPTPHPHEVSDECGARYEAVACPDTDSSYGLSSGVWLSEA